MSTILLTGASGFLGSALARRWSRDAHAVHVIVRPQSSLRRLSDVGERITFHVSKGSDDLRRIVADVDPDAIVHVACAYGRAGESPIEVFEANVGVGVALLQSALDLARPLTFLNAGSVLEPEVSLYALSKQQFAAWGERLAAANPAKLRFVDLRLQHFYGPGDDASKFTTHVVRACRRNEPELRLTAGEQRRDFIHVDDVVSAFDLVLRKAAELPAVEAIEVGSGDAPAVREFVELVHRLARSTTRLAFGAVPYRPSEAMYCSADTTKLRALGWSPVYDLAAGLQQTILEESNP